MKQYEIRWARMPHPIGRRPVLLLTRTPAYAYLNKVIVVEVTRTIRNIPQELDVGRREGLATASVVNFDNVHVVAKAVLGERIGTLVVGTSPRGQACARLRTRLGRAKILVTLDALL